MNFLAHFHLSHQSEAMVAGALLGDFIKGRLTGELDAAIEQGIRLHRHIDACSDSQQAQWRPQFAPELRRYSGIILDVSWDHFLACHWSQFHDQPLTAFSHRIYRQLRAAALPAQARQQAQRLEQHQVLSRCKDWDSVDTTLAYIGRRLKRDNPLSSAAAKITPHYEALERHFLDYYPRLQAQVQQWLANQRRD